MVWEPLILKMVVFGEHGSHRHSIGKTNSKWYIPVNFLRAKNPIHLEIFQYPCTSPEKAYCEIKSALVWITSNIHPKSKFRACYVGHLYKSKYSLWSLVLTTTLVYISLFPCIWWQLQSLVTTGFCIDLKPRFYQTSCSHFSFYFSNMLTIYG